MPQLETLKTDALDTIRVLLTGSDAYAIYER